MQHDPYGAERLAAAADANGKTGAKFDKLADRAQMLGERQSYEQRCDLYRQDQWLNDVLMTVAEKAKPRSKTVLSGQ